jgi:DNA-binding Lrp family transcriptional regulator
LSRTVLVNKGSEEREISLDSADFKMIALLVTGHDTKQISESLKIPLSTVQRHIRKIMLSGIVQTKIEPNFLRLGIKKGLLNVYLSNGDIKEIAMKISKMDGILSCSVHVGNCDVVGEFVYEDSEQLVDTVSNIRHLEGVRNVLWSEEVYSVPVTAENILSSFKKMWNNGSNRKISVTPTAQRNYRNNDYEL